MMYSFPFMNQISSTSSLEKSIQFQIHDENDQNPRFEESSSQNHPPSSSLQLIDCYNNPFLDDDHDHQEFIMGDHILHSQKQHQFLGPNFCHEIGLENANFNTNKEITSTKKRSNNNGGRRKKDRHSKICTSKGPRDRRMRLSLEIARNFFDLQDMLGFDKASKTLEWLFSKSRSAIKELEEKYFSEANCKYNNNGTNFCSSVYDDQQGVRPREKKRRRTLKIVDKESRYEARARARTRTRAKLIRRLEESKSDFVGILDGVCKMGDVAEEINGGTKSFAELRLPDSSMDLSTVSSLDTMIASPAGN